MEGVLALFIPIIAVGGFFLWAISTSPVGKAFAQRIKGPTVEGNTEELRQELAALRQEVAELAERVDFTERRLERPR